MIEAPVSLGEHQTVPLVLPEGLTLTLSREARKGMKVKVAYESVIPAPVVPGQKVARLIVSLPDSEAIEIPLQAAAAVDRLGFAGRIGASLRYLVFGTP